MIGLLFKIISNTCSVVLCEFVSLSEKCSVGSGGCLCHATRICTCVVNYLTGAYVRGAEAFRLLVNRTTYGETGLLSQISNVTLMRTIE